MTDLTSKPFGMNFCDHQTVLAYLFQNLTLNI